MGSKSSLNANLRHQVQWNPEQAMKTEPNTWFKIHNYASHFLNYYNYFAAVDKNV